jgi:hypothetical protein
MYMFVICTVTQEHICSLYNDIIVGRKQSAVCRCCYLRYFILDMSRHTVLVLNNAHSANLLIQVIPLLVPDVFQLSDDIKISPRYPPIKTSLLLSHVNSSAVLPKGFLFYIHVFIHAPEPSPPPAHPPPSGPRPLCPSDRPQLTFFHIFIPQK